MGLASQPTPSPKRVQLLDIGILYKENIKRVKSKAVVGILTCNESIFDSQKYEISADVNWVLSLLMSALTLRETIIFRELMSICRTLHRLM